MKLDKEQREHLAKILSDVGKLIVAIVVLGPLVKPTEVGLSLLITGVLIAFVFFIISTILVKKKEEQKQCKE